MFARRAALSPLSLAARAAALIALNSARSARATAANKPLAASVTRDLDQKRFIMLSPALSASLIMRQPHPRKHSEKSRTVVGHFKRAPTEAGSVERGLNARLKHLTAVGDSGLIIAQPDPQDGRRLAETTGIGNRRGCPTMTSFNQVRWAADSATKLRSVISAIGRDSALRCPPPRVIST